MYKTLEDVMNELAPERRARIEERGRELIREEMTLQAGNVSRFENRSDMLISTLRDYLEAMGGRLELVAHLPGRAPITIEGLAGDSLGDG